MPHVEFPDAVSWLRQVQASSNDSVRAIALRSGLDPSTLNRNVHRGVLTAEAVIAIARGYGLDPVAALVASGHLASTEVRTGETRAALKAATDLELAQEIVSRAHDPGVPGTEA